MNGLDIETTSLDPRAGKIRLVQVSDGLTAWVYDAFKQDADQIRRVIAQTCSPGVAHNAPFEAAWLREHFRIELPLHDTMVMSQVLYTGTKAAQRSNFSHSLANVAKRELKLELAKDEQASDWAADLTREQIEYAARDATVLPPLADRLMRKIERAGLRDVYDLELRVSHAVDAMERRGVAIHTDRLEAMIEESTERLKAELEAEWGINPGSGKQLIEHFELEGRKGGTKTKGGKPKTDQEAMKRLIDEKPSVKKWIE